MTMFKPGDKVRRKPEYQCDEWTLGDRVPTVSGHSPVYPCGIFLDGLGRSCDESRFDLVEDAPAKAFGTLSDDDIKVGETYWLDSFDVLSKSTPAGGCHCYMPWGGVWPDKVTVTMAEDFPSGKAFRGREVLGWVRVPVRRCRGRRARYR